MTQSLHTHIKAPEPIDGVDKVLANMSDHGLPFKLPQPVPFNAGYMCHRMGWKTPTNFAVDVLVATVSLFMAYWTLLNFVLRCLAVRSSPHGKWLSSTHDILLIELYTPRQGIIAYALAATNCPIMRPLCQISTSFAL